MTSTCRRHPGKAPGVCCQAGFALASAIFLLVVLAALGAYMAHVSIHQQAGHTADVRGRQAFQAARAGIEWGVFQWVRSNGCTAATSFSPGGGLNSFTVTVACTPSNTADQNTEERGGGPEPVRIRRIVATACNAPGAGGVCPNPAPGDNYVERQIAVVVSQE